MDVPVGVVLTETLCLDLIKDSKTGVIVILFFIFNHNLHCFVPAASFSSSFQRTNRVILFTYVRVRQTSVNLPSLEGNSDLPRIPLPLSLKGGPGGKIIMHAFISHRAAAFMCDRADKGGKRRAAVS